MFEMIKNPDLLELIFRYLDPASVKAASLVSRYIPLVLEVITSFIVSLLGSGIRLSRNQSTGGGRD